MSKGVFRGYSDGLCASAAVQVVSSNSLTIMDEEIVKMIEITFTSTFRVNQYYRD